MEGDRQGWPDLTRSLIEPQHLFLSEEEGMHKPFPKFFRRAAARLGVSPTRCLFVGDNLAVDAIGAVQSGFAAGLWLDRHRLWNGEQLPVPRITGLKQVLNYLC